MCTAILQANLFNNALRCRATGNYAAFGITPVFYHEVLIDKTVLELYNTVMRYVEGIQGGQALEVPSGEYSLAGRALDLELAYQPWEGSYMFDRADEPFVELTIEGRLGAQRRQEPSHHDIIAGARMLTGLLHEAGFLATATRAHGIVAEVNHFDAPEEHRQLFVEMDAEAGAAEEAQRQGIGLRASDLARRESLVLTPPVATMTVSGLRRVAASHSFLGGLHFRYQQFRSSTGAMPQTASQIFDRPDRPTRLRAIETLKSLRS